MLPFVRYQPRTDRGRWGAAPVLRWPGWEVGHSRPQRSVSLVASVVTHRGTGEWVLEWTELDVPSGSCRMGAICGVF